MKFITYEYDGAERVGIVSADEKWVQDTGAESMIALIKTGKVQVASRPVPLDDVKILAPIPHPEGDVIGVGMNYKDHAEEAAKTSPELAKALTPFFGKRVDRAVAPGDPIEAHEDMDPALDYEVELAVVIGKDARYVSAEDAFDYVFGYTVINDVSARNVQMGHSQFFFGKGLDGFTPIGPWIVTEDEFERPPKLDICSYVNGELRQKSNTGMLIRGVAELIEELSQGMTLKAGTIIATGTPAGVGMGFDPPKYMVPGDVVRCEIEGIGVLENPVKASKE